jgi:hypothetical protein
MLMGRPLARTLACLLVLALAFPAGMVAQSGGGPPRAGEVAQMVPAVEIARGASRLAADRKAPVHWEDSVETAAAGRARIRLDDGSTLNVGSASSLRIARHDAAAQRTELELRYGRIRSDVVRLARPGASYEVRTPVGTAGVTGTDFFLAFENGVATLIVYRGSVRFCNLAGECVAVLAGMMSAIAAAAGALPSAPQSVPQALAMDAAQSTRVDSPRTTGMSAKKSVWLGVAAASAAAVVGIVLATRGSSGEAFFRDGQP